MSENMKNTAEKRGVLYKELNMPSNLPMILCALPPNQLPLGRFECDFKDYNEIIRFFVESLTSIKGYNVIINLHPRENFDDMKYIEKYGVKISKKDSTNKKQIKG